MTEQFINKSTLKDNYSVVPNNMLNDEGLDADCLAVLVYLLSKPSNWIVKPTNLQNRFKFGRDKAYRIINQLIKKQYIVREEHRVEGKYTSFTYYVYDSPFPCLSDTAESYTANQHLTKYRKTLSKEKILMTDQLKTDLNTVSESYKWYKNWLTEYTSFKEAGVIIGKLRKMAHEKGWKSNEDKDKLVLSIFERAANAKPEGDIYAYLLVMFKNITSEIKVAATVDPVRSRWEARAKTYDMGKGNWIFKNCPPPSDPEFRYHCPSQYLHLFGVT